MTTIMQTMDLIGFKLNLFMKYKAE